MAYCCAVAGPSSSPRPTVALVHDYLNQPGGAERVVLEMTTMWPDAPVYTSLYRPDSTFPGFQDVEVHTTVLNRLPVDEGFRNLFPLYSTAFRLLRINADMIVSSSSGWAHRIRRPPDSFHAIYCHTPARWLFADEYMRSTRRQQALMPVGALLRQGDRRAALRADLYIANGRLTRERIRRAYGLDAPIVAPPVDTNRFTPRPRGERLLVVSRLLPYKRVDLVVSAATRAGIGLDVVGRGPALEALRASAGPTVEFHGQLTDAEVTTLMEGCRAVCVPGVEDFGITPVEANAAGKPVIAFAQGGALETLSDGVTGVFFHKQEVEQVLEAIVECDRLHTCEKALAQAATRFSRNAFRERLTQTLEAAQTARAA